MAASNSRGRAPAQARLKAILTHLSSGGTVSVAQLAQRFGVSDMTIRRDLTELEREGLLERVHGGAIATAPEPITVMDDHEPAFSVRARHCADAKSRIALAALPLLEGLGTVAIDVGSTTLSAARVLAEHRSEEQSPRVFTNSLRVANVMGRAHIRTYLPAGQLRAEEMSIIGPAAVASFSQFYFEAVMIGAAGMTADGVFDYSPEDSAMKHVFLAQSQRRILLADQSKFRRLSTVRVAGLEAFTDLVTDAPPPPDLQRAMERAGLRLHLAT